MGIWRVKNAPGHIGLISENHPGITEDIPLASLTLLEVLMLSPLVSMAAAAEETPFSSSSLGRLTGKSVQLTGAPLSSAIDTLKGIKPKKRDGN